MIRTHTPDNMFLFGRCLYSLAVVTPAKYELDLDILRGNFTKSSISQEINEWSFSNPHPRCHLNLLQCCIF